MLKQIVATPIGRGLRHVGSVVGALHLERRWTWSAVGAILIAFALWQALAPNGDLYQYRCFALAFWKGSSEAIRAPGCVGRLPTGPFPAFHVLPREYPPLALLVFSLPLLAGGQISMLIYVLAFNALMLGCLGATAALVARASSGVAESPRAEQAYLLWLAVGSTTIALVRFDAAPALLTVAALILALRRPSWIPYALLALATMLKLYPALFIALLAAWDWRRRGRRSPGRLLPVWAGGPLLAGAIIVVVQAVADAFARSPGVPWLSVQGGRPAQIESTAAGLVWLWDVMTGHGSGLHVVNVQRSLAFVDPLGSRLATITLTLALLGVAWAMFAIASGKLAPLRGIAGGLLALLAGSSIFSPQYLIWASPLVALALAEHPPSPLDAMDGPRGDIGFHARVGGSDGLQAASAVPRPFLAWMGAIRNRVQMSRGASALGWTGACVCTTIVYSIGYLYGWPTEGSVTLVYFMGLVVVRDALVWLVAYLLLRPDRPTAKPADPPDAR
jgi:hypothetical protein